MVLTQVSVAGMDFLTSVYWGSWPVAVPGTRSNKQLRAVQVARSDSSRRLGDTSDERGHASRALDKSGTDPLRGADCTHATSSRNGSERHARFPRRSSLLGRARAARHSERSELDAAARNGFLTHANVG